MIPYQDIESGDNWVLREFSQQVDPVELLLHRDDEDRIVEALHQTDWMIKLDNNLPINILEQIAIPKHAWHRLIKGSGNLNVKIYKKG